MRNVKTEQQKHKVIFSSRIAKQIIEDRVFLTNLVSIEPNEDNTGRSVFIFKMDKEFDDYLFRKFNIK